jgi:hypothetical protein
LVDGDREGGGRIAQRPSAISASSRAYRCRVVVVGHHLEIVAGLTEIPPEQFWRSRRRGGSLA